MSATTSAPLRLDAPARRITFAEAMDSEFAKIRSVRSTYWTLLICLLVSVGISLLIAAVTAANWDTISQSDRASTGMSTVVAGVYFGVLVTGVLGVMVVSTEYGTGMMRTSLTAFPRRAMLFLAKASVLTIVVLLLGVVIAFASYAVASPFYTRHGVDLSLSETANLRALLAVPVYLTLVALMGLGLGFLLRHTAGAISSLVSLFFVLPIRSGPSGIGTPERPAGRQARAAAPYVRRLFPREFQQAVCQWRRSVTPPPEPYSGTPGQATTCGVPGGISWSQPGQR